jgi:hypothetical protein
VSFVDNAVSKPLHQGAGHRRQQHHPPQREIFLRQGGEVVLAEDGDALARSMTTTRG